MQDAINGEKSRFARALLTVGILIGAFVSCGGVAQASTYFFSGFVAGPSGGTVSLDITTGAAAGLGFDITNVTGTVLGDNVTLLGTPTTPPGYQTSPDGEWYYDNIFYPSFNSPYSTLFDNPGLLLLDTVSNTDINIFSPGVTALAQYTLGQSPGQEQRDLLVIGAGLSAVPLPATWSMLIIGFICLGYFAFRGQREGRVKS
jgi:hypothetical protein